MRPSSDARVVDCLLKVSDGGVVVDRFGIHRANYADVVSDLLSVGQQIADLSTALAAARKTIFARLHRQARLARYHAGDALALAHGIRKSS